MYTENPLAMERRMLVKGWKDNPTNTFVSCHNFADDGFIATERARIGEDVPNWQPHITEVVVERRYVTPWMVEA